MFIQQGEGTINADLIPRMPPAGLHRVHLACDGMEEPSMVGNSGNVIETRMIRARVQASRMTGRSYSGRTLSLRGKFVSTLTGVKSYRQGKTLFEKAWR